MIKGNEISSYKDLLKPQYKDKVTINDPSITGAGIGLMGHLAYQLWTEPEAIQYLKDLLTNGTTVMRDQRLQAEWIARGKTPLALACDPKSYTAFVQAGANLRNVITREGVYITTGDGAVAVPPKVAHPNAAAVFINWLLTKDGQAIYSKAAPTMSMRKDVSTDPIPPDLVPGPEEKTFVDTEEYVLQRGKFLGTVKKVIDEAAK